MGLLGHQGSRYEWKQRVASLLGGFAKPPHLAENSRLRPGRKPLLNPAAAHAAQAYYAGDVALADEEFHSLKWLEHFAQTGKQLLLCYAMQLLSSWCENNRPPLSLKEETEILRRLAAAAGPIAAVLPADQQRPVVKALACQVKRLLHLKPETPHACLAKALSLTAASNALVGADALSTEASRLFDLALPQLIAADGSPARENLAQFLCWVPDFLALQPSQLSLASLAARDRLLPFLALLRRADAQWCMDGAAPIDDQLLNMAPLHHAWVCGAARLEAGKLVLIHLPSQLAGQSVFSLSLPRLPLLTAGVFQSEPDEDPPTRHIEMSQGPSGHLLHIENAASERIIFVSTRGDDIRVEEITPADGHQRWLRLRLPALCKISVARNGQQATIAFDPKNLWQLTLRGARMLPPQDDGQLILNQRNNVSGKVNWALKKIGRDAHKLPAQTSLELPF